MKRTRKLAVTLEITVSDLPDDVREDLAKGQDISVDELPGAFDAEAWDYGDLFWCDAPTMWSEFFAGSDVYGQFDDVRVRGSQWVDEEVVAQKEKSK